MQDRIIPNYRAMNSGEFLQSVGTDAQKWADAFCQIHPSGDHDLLRSWFANAIMAGHDAAIREASSSAEFLAAFSDC